MILDIVVNKTNDGFTAEVPSIKGCECWAPNEEEVLEKIVELSKYYLKLGKEDKINLDKARGNFDKKIYKLVFNKTF